MKILQVKEYNKTIAQEKQFKALENWKQREHKYGYPVKSMFYFMLEDRQGYPTEERKKGYIRYNEYSARYFKNREQAEIK